MIHASGLTKHFKVKNHIVEAVTSLDMHVEAGELVALLGPNGAGKSTTLRMLTTLLRPTAGTAQVVGLDVRKDPRGVRSRIGYVGQGNAAGHNHRARDELYTQARAYGMPRRAAKARVDELCTSLELDSVADRVVSSLSGGQRRRLDIAMGLVHTPKLLFFDEPSTGLDPQSRANVHDHIRGLRDRYGTTILFTTHYLDEADRLAQRVIVIDHGRVIADETPARLKAEHSGDRITLTFADEDDARLAMSYGFGIEPPHVTRHERTIVLVADVLLRLHRSWCDYSVSAAYLW